MSYVKKRNKIIYWACLILYILALSAAAVFALKLVWDFSILYEDSMPDKVIDEYIATLSSDLWEEGLADTMAAMEHPFQTDEECRDVVLGLLDGEINYVRTTSSEPDTNAYSLLCENSSFGKVYLIRDDTKNANFDVYGKEITLPWDLRPWLVYKEEFDLTGLYTSVEVTVPASYSVQINGTTLTPDHIVETGIQFDSLKDFYAVNPNLPTKCTYRADNIIGHITPVVLNESGEVYTIDTTKDDSQYIKPCTEEKKMRLNDFCGKFVELYLRYSSSVMGKNSGGGYSALTAYVAPGGDLDKRLLDALDGLSSWSHTNFFRLDDYRLLDAVDLGAGYYVCTVQATTTTITDAHGENQDVTELKIIVQDNNGDIRALSLA